jgi:hypothetical protein
LSADVGLFSPTDLLVGIGTVLVMRISTAAINSAGESPPIHSGLLHALDVVIFDDMFVVVLALGRSVHEGLMVLGRNVVNNVLIPVLKPDRHLPILRIVLRPVQMIAADFGEPIEAMATHKTPRLF